jgi:hypothetical protein
MRWSARKPPIPWPGFGTFSEFPASMVHSCHPSYCGKPKTGGLQCRPVWAKSRSDLKNNLNIKGDAIEHLPSKYEALSSTPHTTKKKKNWGRYKLQQEARSTGDWRSRSSLLFSYKRAKAINGVSSGGVTKGVCAVSGWDFTLGWTCILARDNCPLAALWGKGTGWQCFVKEEFGSKPTFPGSDTAPQGLLSRHDLRELKFACILLKSKVNLSTPSSPKNWVTSA